MYASLKKENINLKIFQPPGRMRQQSGIHPFGRTIQSGMGLKRPKPINSDSFNKEEKDFDKEDVDREVQSDGKNTIDKNKEKDQNLEKDKYKEYLAKLKKLQKQLAEKEIKINNLETQVETYKKIQKNTSITEVYHNTIEDGNKIYFYSI